MRRLTVLLLIGIAARSTTLAHAGFVNFETLPGGGAPTEGMPINTQYLASQGMSFSLEGGPSPMIVERGAPRTGFLGYDDGINSPLDQPAPGQGVGNFFINNNNLVEAVAPLPFVVSYALTAGLVSGVILDIDNDNESWRVEALSSGGLVLATLDLAWNDPSGVGNGIATPWSFTRAERDIAAVRLIYTGTLVHDVGYAFDNFASANIVPEPSSVALLCTGLLTVVGRAWFRRSRAGTSAVSV